MWRNKLIISGWGLYLVSLVMPWSEAPFSGWIGGWWWQVIDLVKFFDLVSLYEFSVQAVAGFLAVVAAGIMWLSPLLLHLLNKDVKKLYGHLTVAAFVLALLSVLAKFYYMATSPQAIPGLYILGNLVWLASFGLLAVGFHRQYLSNTQEMLRA
jgi:hypothetical protein